MSESEWQLGSGCGFGVVVDGWFVGEVTPSSIQRGPSRTALSDTGSTRRLPAGFWCPRQSWSYCNASESPPGLVDIPHSRGRVVVRRPVRQPEPEPVRVRPYRPVCRRGRTLDGDTRTPAPMAVELHSNGLEGSGQESMTKAVVAKLHAPNAQIPPRTHLPRLAARRVMTRSGTSASPYRPLRPASTLYA